jgi:hypothetical protein
VRKTTVYDVMRRLLNVKNIMVRSSLESAIMLALGCSFVSLDSFLVVARVAGLPVLCFLDSCGLLVPADLAS